MLEVNALNPFEYDWFIVRFPFYGRIRFSGHGKHVTEDHAFSSEKMAMDKE
jgi:hypothetical protein